VTENEYGDYKIMAETTAYPSFSCPECGSPAIGYGKKEQLFMDTLMHGKRTGIVVVCFMGCISDHGMTVKQEGALTMLISSPPNASQSTRHYEEYGMICLTTYR
jgi:hypothetical protein